jgi:6-phosphofructokinase
VESEGGGSCPGLHDYASTIVRTALARVFGQPRGVEWVAQGIAADLGKAAQDGMSGHAGCDKS